MLRKLGARNRPMSAELPRLLEQALVVLGISPFPIEIVERGVVKRRLGCRLAFAIDVDRTREVESRMADGAG